MSNEQILKKLQHVQVSGQQAQGSTLTGFSMATRSEETGDLEPRHIGHFRLLLTYLFVNYRVSTGDWRRQTKFVPKL